MNKYFERKYLFFSFLALGYLSILIFIVTQDDKNCSDTFFTLKINTITILTFNILYNIYLLISNYLKNYNKRIHIIKIIIDSILSHFLYYNIIESHTCKAEVNLLWCWSLITLIFNVISIIIYIILIFFLYKD